MGDFTDADIIFVCSILFPAQMMAELASIARWMKPGSRIVSHQAFSGPEFEEIGAFYTPTSWEDSTRWIVQQVVCNPGDAAAKPVGLKQLKQFDSRTHCSFSIA